MSAEKMQNNLMKMKPLMQIALTCNLAYFREVEGIGN